MQKIINPILESVGFDTWGEFIGSVFVIKMKSVYLLGVGLSLLWTFIDGFIEDNIFSPALGIYILAALTFMDVMLGISRAVREERFTGIKFQRSTMRFVVQLFIIGISFQMVKVWPVVIRPWMVDAVLISFNLATLWSIIENAYALRWIQPATYVMLKRIISIDSLIQKFFNKDDKDESST